MYLDFYINQTKQESKQSRKNQRRPNAPNFIEIGQAVGALLRIHEGDSDETNR
jgi:hypothetical protein